MSSSPSPNPDSIVRSVFRRQVFSQRLRSAGLGVLGIGWLWLLSDVADDTMLFYKGAQRGLRLAAESAEVKKVRGHAGNDHERVCELVCLFK